MKCDMENVLALEKKWDILSLLHPGGKSFTLDWDLSININIILPHLPVTTSALY